MTDKMNIFFCADSYAMEGLGVALTSMIRNCADNKSLKIWILCSNISKKDRENIKQLLVFEEFTGEAEFVDFDAEKEFHHFRPNYGNRMVYGRFLIPEILKTGNAFYLDADITVNLDILELQNFISDKLIGAVERRKFYSALESDFLVNKLGLEPETSYFNAGILIINVDEWHRQNISEKLIEIGEKYSNELRQADQTMLNVICNGNYNQLPQRFNNGFMPSEIKEEAELANSIIHFIDYPKPWDIWGRKLHKGYSQWAKYQTPFWKARYKSVSYSKLRSMQRNKRLYKNFISGYVKYVWKRLRGKLN